MREQDLSEDEDMSPDQPSFVGLFKPQIFCSLLHKAKTTTRLGILDPAAEEVDHSLPLFQEPTFETEEVPAPKLFRDVIQRQWTAPISGPNPNGLNKCLYNLASDLSTLLQVPEVDTLVVTLSSPSVLTGPSEESLCPEDRWSLCLPD